MSEYNAFLDIVTQKDDPKINRNKPKCPFCNSKKVNFQETSSTLVGGYNNHIHYDCTCIKCKQSFEMEIAEKGRRNSYIGWYTKDGRVLGGIPGCFENYIYTCKKCGGDVKRHCFELNSDIPVKYLSSAPDKNGVWKDDYRNVFKCESCGIQIESKNSYFDRNPPPLRTYEEEVEEAKRREKASEKLCKEWTITEEVGICIMNNSCLRSCLSLNEILNSNPDKNQVEK